MGGDGASPLNLQRIAARGPFFQGWLVRAIDHAARRSLVLIVASFSREGSAAFDEHYVFCAVADGDATRTFKGFPAPSRVTASPPGERGALDLRWHAERDASSARLASQDVTARLDFTDSLCLADCAFDDALSVSMRVTERLPWREEGALSLGPEGWLGRTPLLPSRYFIHSVGSSVEYSVRLEGRALEGRGSSHMECNYGNFFPRGWVWAQAIGRDNTSSFSLVIGRIVVGPLEPFIATFYLRRDDGRTAVFRTTDLDRVRYDLDGVRKVAHLDFVSSFTRRRATLRIEARDPSFHKVFTPTPRGMSDAPGCEETYTAVATATYEDDGGRETHVFPLTAFEFGGSFIGAVHRNAHLAPAEAVR
jgi:hypothetical protein